MSPEKRKRRSDRRPKPAQSGTARIADPGPPYVVLWHPEADVECAAVHDPAERVAIQHARDKLEALGPKLATPHSSAIKGNDGVGLRELRPRGGRSRWRPIYKRVRPGVFVILAVAPEAQIDKRRFDQSIRHAKSRLDGLEA